ncbi:MAG: NAD(P)H-binding protein [Candidatus Marinimicrobia bacterium]|nr:NAD(P)H-binding protein [FCB group bacterium]MBL7024542.1 NAD(P)H-binding protein [Candidatus Neomarinimicrobiota bacterium]
MAKKIIVFGGTGYYGRTVVAALVARGQLVRVVSRNAEGARAVVGSEVEIFEGDVTRPGDINRALQGMDVIVICLAAMSVKLIRKMQAIERDAVLNIMLEAKKLNISRLIYMSGYEMRASLLDDLKIPEFGAIKIEIEAALRASDLNWTILGDAPAFELFFAFLRGNKMTVPGGGLKAIPTISAEDVGEITAQTALRDDLGGQRIRLTGPQAYNFPEVAALISEITGSAIQHMAIPLTVVNVISALIYPITPFPRYLYQSLLLLNNFPADLADEVPRDHQKLLELFDYEPRTLEAEIEGRLGRKAE